MFEVFLEVISTVATVAATLITWKCRPKPQQGDDAAEE